MTPIDLRSQATHREAEQIAGAARRLERRARGTRLETAAAATQALLRDAGVETSSVDATLSVVDEEELRRRAITDGNAVAELCRRSSALVAA
jgi:hypothetical protein